MAERIGQSKTTTSVYYKMATDMEEWVNKTILSSDCLDSQDEDDGVLNCKYLGYNHTRPLEYYSTKYAIVGTLFQSIIFIVGVLGKSN